MPRGGPRPGSGPRTSPGPYGEPTRVLRIPLSRIDQVRAFLNRGRAPEANVTRIGVPDPQAPERLRPLYAHRVPAGFPSPAEDHIETPLDLNDLLIRHQAATFFVRVSGHSMTEVGILDGDILTVDRSLEARHGDTVLAVIDDTFTVKELERHEGQWRLIPRHPDFAPIALQPGQELHIWGVVTGVVRRLR